MIRFCPAIAGLGHDERNLMLQLDRVALHLVVERGALNTEKFRRLFFVPVTFSKRLNNGGSFNIVEALDARTR
jgi:hypothetical protein